MIKVFLALLLAGAPATYQEGYTIAPADTKPSLTLPTGTPISLTVSEEISSKTAVVGATVYFSVRDDVRFDGHVVIPRGTPAVGQITAARKTGAFGRSGVLEISLKTLRLRSYDLRITGLLSNRGSGGTAATIGTAALVGPFAAFVTGKSATVLAGTDVQATTLEELRLVSLSEVADKKADLEAAQLVVAKAATSRSRQAWLECTMANAARWSAQREVASNIAVAAADICPIERSSFRDAISNELTIQRAYSVLDSVMQSSQVSLTSNLTAYIMDIRSGRPVKRYESK